MQTETEMEVAPSAERYEAMQTEAETETSAPSAERSTDVGGSAAATGQARNAPADATTENATAAPSNAATVGRKRTKFTDTYYGKKGRGKYQDDHDRLLLGLLPKRGRSFDLSSMSDTVGGEIMRAAASLSTNFYKNNALDQSADALNFLAMAGVFDKNDGTLETLHPYAKGTKAYEGKFDGDEVQMAVERAIDRAVECLLAYPDFEYTENAIDMAKLREECEVDFVERTLTVHTLAGMHAASDATSNEGQNVSSPTMKDVPLQEIDTPRIANKITFDDVASASSNGTCEVQV